MNTTPNKPQDHWNVIYTLYAPNKEYIHLLTYIVLWVGSTDSQRILNVENFKIFVPNFKELAVFGAFSLSLDFFTPYTASHWFYASIWFIHYELLHIKHELASNPFLYAFLGWDAINSYFCRKFFALSEDPPWWSYKKWFFSTLFP